MQMTFLPSGTIMARAIRSIYRWVGFYIFRCTWLALRQGHSVSAQRYTVYGVPSENLEVVLQGQARPSEIILAGAHYDVGKRQPGR